MDYKLQTIYENMQIMDRIDTLNDQGDVNTMGTMSAPSQEANEECSDQDADAAKSACLAIYKHIECIANNIQNMSDIPNWIQTKLAICSEYLGDIADVVSYEATKSSQSCTAVVASDEGVYL